MAPWLRQLVLAALVLPWLACASSMSTQQEARLGDQMARQVQAQLPMLNDPVLDAYVQEIGGRILDAIGPQPFRYRFYVVADPEINAFAMPGGHIYVNAGTILWSRNVTELAGVIAHEIGHVWHRHIAENIERERWVGIAGDMAVLGSAILGGPTGAVGLASDLGSIGVMNTFGRDAEREADEFAIVALVRAGYDPKGLLSFFHTLHRKEAMEGPGRVAFLSSHPATEERIQAAHDGISQLPAIEGLALDDNGKLEIIQRRLELLVMGGRDGGTAAGPGSR
ncbi:MAG: M48 family metallopeptidase [Myxococcota bacterium]|nr:M48 family metallopeptidase [Myxococcota bacterium]